MPKSYTRLTEPMVRDDGVLRAVSWEEALDRATSGFRPTIEHHGPDRIAAMSCSKATNEMNFLAQKLTGAAFRSHNIDSCNRTSPTRCNAGRSPPAMMMRVGWMEAGGIDPAARQQASNSDCGRSPTLQD